MAKILIVDDSKLIRIRLATILKKDHHEIIAKAINGEKAIKIFKETDPDLILMDITMPVMNGIDAIKEILKIDEEVIIIVCSAMWQQDIVMEAIELGAKDFIVKPFEEAKVLETVNYVLEQYGGST